MPGFFEGGPPTPADAGRVLRQIVDGDELDEDERAAADVDGDGRPGAADALYLLKAAQDEDLLPAEPPVLERVRPALARPGASLTLTGRVLSAPADPGTVLLRHGDDQTELAPSAASPLEMAVTLPSGVAGGEVSLRVLRGGLLSNEIDVAVRVGPVAYAVAPEFAAAGDAVEISGAGFGGDADVVSVGFGGLVAQPSAVTDDRVMVSVPAGGSGGVSVVVRRGSEEANPLEFAYAVGVQGTVELPSGSPLSVSSLQVYTNTGGGPVPVAPSGAFWLTVPESRPLLVEAQDPDHDVVVAASLAGPGEPAELNAESTATWLVLFGCGAYVMPDSQRAALREDLATSAEVSALAAAIQGGHASRPKLFELIAEPGVEAAYHAALEFARDRIALLQLQPVP